MIDITPKLSEKFQQDGLLCVEQLISADTAHRLADRFEHLFTGNFETGVKPDEINWQMGESDESLTRQICNAWKADRIIAKTVLDEEIGRACASLANWPGSRLMHDNVLWKPPGARPLGFHQDNSYLDWFTPLGIITCWIALDDITPESGAMELVRGSHRWGHFPMPDQFHGPEHYKCHMETAARSVGILPEIISIEVSKGGGSFHHGWTWHGSGYNRSLGPRRALVVHMCSSESRFVLDNLGRGNGAVYARYRRLGDDTMDENYFPITWRQDGYRSAGIDTYLQVKP